jgi:arylsulfatase
LDPFERTIWPENQSLHGSLEYFGWYQYQFWRYVFVQQYVAKLAATAIE